VYYLICVYLACLLVIGRWEVVQKPRSLRGESFRLWL
jgi:hypothetical protein